MNYSKMSPSEQQAWAEQVQTYLQETHPQLLGVQTWDEMPTEFEQIGCQLARSIVRARDVAENPRRFKARQAVRLIGAHLTDAMTAVGKSPLPASPKGEETPPVSEKREERKEASQQQTPQPPLGGAGQQQTQPQNPPLKGVGWSAVGGSNLQATTAAAATERGMHLSDYLYMLPAELKEAAQTLEQMYLEQADLSQRSESLADAYERSSKAGNTEDMEHLKQQAEPINRQLVSVNQGIRAFWKQVDEAVEFYKAHGFVRPNDLDRPQSTSAATMQVNEDMLPEGCRGKRPSECLKADIEQIEDPVLRHQFEVARIENNKKYIRRTDTRQTPEWVAQMQLRVDELLAWGEKFTPKRKEALIAVGVKL